MHSLRHISDEHADHLLSGDLRAGDDSLDELTAFVLDVGAAYSEPPTGPVKARHLDAMRRAARPRAAGWNPFAELGSAPGREGPGLPERVRRGLAALIPRPAAVAAALAFCLLFSSLTALGALPDRVQAAVADAVRAVGVSVPDPDAKPRPAHRHPTSPSPVPRSPVRPSRPVPPGHAAAPAPAPAPAPMRRAPAAPDCPARGCDKGGWQEVDPPPASVGPPETQPVEPLHQPPAQAPAEPGPGVTPQPEADRQPAP